MCGCVTNIRCACTSWAAWLRRVSTSSISSTSSSTSCSTNSSTSCRTSLSTSCTSWAAWLRRVRRRNMRGPTRQTWSHPQTKTRWRQIIDNRPEDWVLLTKWVPLDELQQANRNLWPKLLRTVGKHWKLLSNCCRTDYLFPSFKLSPTYRQRSPQSQHQQRRQCQQVLSWHPQHQEVLQSSLNNRSEWVTDRVDSGQIWVDKGGEGCKMVDNGRTWIG